MMDFTTIVIPTSNAIAFPSVVLVDEYCIIIIIMEARVSNVNSLSEMEWKMKQSECDALYTYLSKGVAIP